jgi:hypothetical protein
VTEAVGAAGPAGTAFTVRTVAVDIHPVVVFCAVTLYDPGVKPVKVVLA